MNHQHVRLGIGRDRVGDRLGAGLDAPVRIAGFEHAAPAFDFALEIGGPALRQVEAHRHRHQHHALALERLGIGGRARIVVGDRGCTASARHRSAEQ